MKPLLLGGLDASWSVFASVGQAFPQTLCVQGAVCFWKGKWKAGVQRGREGNESMREIILHPKLGGAGVCVSRDGMVSTERSCLTSHEGSLFTGTGTPFPSHNPRQGLLFLRGLDLSSGHPLAGCPVAQSVHCVPEEAHVGCGAHERGGDFEQAERCCLGREATICFNRSGCLSSRPFSRLWAPDTTRLVSGGEACPGSLVHLSALPTAKEGLAGQHPPPLGGIILSGIVPQRANSRDTRASNFVDTCEK